MTPNDNFYLLTISNNTPGGDGNIYMCDYIPGRVDEGDRDDYKFDMSMDIKDAKVFYSRQDAWNFREDVGRGHTWQITPMSAKAIFERKLKSK
jgi:hypothetical protein